MGCEDRPVFLVGFMGCGKSTVGRLLATHLGWDFVDTDDLVVERDGRTIECIFAEDGEECFRALELQSLQSLEPRRRCVVATGGGLFRAASRRRALATFGTTVWLDAPLEVCRKRVLGGGGRPLWTESGDAVGFRAAFDRRRACYALASLHVAATGAPEEVVREIVRELEPVFP